VRYQRVQNGGSVARRVHKVAVQQGGLIRWQCSKEGAYGGSVARRVEMVQHDEEVKWLLVTYHEEVVTDDTGWCKVLRLMLFLVVGCTAI
jgi:hypothetical protein